MLDMNKLPKEIEAEIQELYTTDKYGTIHRNWGRKPSDKLTQYFAPELKFDQNLHSTCVACKVLHLHRYRNQVSTTYDMGKFNVNCKGISKGLTNAQKQKVVLTAEQNGLPVDLAVKAAIASVDPVTWAELMFGFSEDTPEWKLRPFQKEVLRCTADRLVIRAGRRSGKSFCVALKLLHLLFNKQMPYGRDANGNVIMGGVRIAVITPFLSQLNEIFGAMESLLKRNKDLLARVALTPKKDTYSRTPPYEMELKAEMYAPVIRGYVTGTNSKEDGTGGGTIRGISVDVIYMDEMDMIPADILSKVIKPLLATHGEVQLIASSTPIRRKGMFYQYCNESPNFKEVYAPSTILPHWDKIAQEEENSNTKDAFEVEFLAKFVDGLTGVFKSEDIMAAIKEYEYRDMEDSKKMKEITRYHVKENLMRCIGIDWNKNAGTEFVVTQYDPATGRFWVIDAVNIPASEFSADVWKSELKRLNYKWIPKWIYADEGYGHTIIEDLLLEARKTMVLPKKSLFDVETANLSVRLKKYNFSSNISMRDPITGQEFVKPAKPLLVETVVRLFERKMVTIPMHDKTLIKQLGNYEVLKLNAQNGRPVYGPADSKIADHRLDAFMLSIIGIYLEGGLYSHHRTWASEPAVISGDEAVPEFNLKDLINAGLHVTQIHRQVDPAKDLREDIAKGAYLISPNRSRTKLEDETTSDPKWVARRSRPIGDRRANRQGRGR